MVSFRDNLSLSFCCVVCMDYECFLPPLWSQEAHVTQAETNKPPGQPNAGTPTPVPKTKVHAQHYSRTPACIPLCLCIDSSQRTCYGNLYTGTMQCCCFCMTLSRSNLHEPRKFPYIVLFNTTHVISLYLT